MGVGVPRSQNRAHEYRLAFACRAGLAGRPPPDPETLNDVEARLFLAEEKYDPQLSLRAVSGPEVTGFILGLDASDRDMVTSYIHVSPAHRRRGIARDLKISLLNRARSEGFHHALALLNRKTTAAWALNRSLGYREVAQDGIHAKVFRDSS